METSNNWYEIKNIQELDSPALVVYPERILQNIRKMIEIAESTERLRPHVKTNKMREVVEMMLREGITKFKCATIAEAEMLGLAKAPDVLLAYQPVGPKIDRLLNLTRVFPDTCFSFIVDNESTANQVAERFKKCQHKVGIFIDLNVGDDRTGINPGIDAELLVKQCRHLDGLEFKGFHIYDGHIRHRKIKKRTKACDFDFSKAVKFIKAVTGDEDKELEIIAGGTPTFPIHAMREGVTCSPGTLVLWDYGYSTILQDMDFQWAALVITRVVSVIGEDLICVDLGHKSIASENPFPRVHFLNAGKLEQISHSEEHLILKVKDNRNYKVGDVLYGVPYHICPTTALYERAFVVENSEVQDEWMVVARDRRITI